MNKRIQRKRTKGWRMPPNTIYVGRPSKWGNPFELGKDGNIDTVLFRYKQWLEGELQDRPNLLEPLMGKDLACWCPLDKPCHADVLLKFVHEEEEAKNKRIRTMELERNEALGFHT